MDYHCGKVRADRQTDRQTESHTDAAKRLTPAIVVIIPTSLTIIIHSSNTTQLIT